MVPSSIGAVDHIAVCAFRGIPVEGNCGEDFLSSQIKV